MMKKKASNKRSAPSVPGARKVVRKTSASTARQPNPLVREKSSTVKPGRPQFRPNMHGAVLRNLQKWVASLDEPVRDKPIAGTAGGNGITPRTLVTHVEKLTPIGKQYVASFERLALNHVMGKFSNLGGGPV